MSVRRGLQQATIAVALLACASRPAVGQGVRFDTAAARAYTIDALVQATRTSARLVREVPAAAGALVIVDRVLARVDRPAVTRLPLGVLARSQVRSGDAPQATFAQVARFRRREVVPGLGAGDAADLDTLTRLTVAELQRAMEARQPPVPDDSIDTILAPLTALHLSELEVSIAQSLEKLNRFERKYGPDSPRLNIVEVGLNYVAQWVPIFKPNTEGWPSRFEVVTSYVPLYLTVVDGKARPVTVAELGLRSYVWQRGWGGSEGGALRPGYLSFGVAVAGDRDGAFVSPLKGTRRIGGFIGWGDIKLALLGGSERRLLLTRQFQMVPWVF